MSVREDTLILTRQGFRFTPALPNSNVEVWNGDAWVSAEVEAAGTEKCITLFLHVTRIFTESVGTIEFDLTVALSRSTQVLLGDGRVVAVADLAVGNELAKWRMESGIAHVASVTKVEEDASESAVYSVRTPGAGTVICNWVLIGGALGA